MSQNSRVPAEARSYVNRVLFGSFALAIALPLTALAIYCANLPTAGWEAFAAASMVSAASYLVGGLLGFLFGVPRALSGDRGATSGEQHLRLIANTNLEEVSDWLTKIIVGATLVQLGSLSRRIGALAASVSSIFGTPSEQNKIMAGAIILYSAVLGFYVFYVGARSIITFLFDILPSDWISERQDMPAKRSPHEAEESQSEPSESTRPDSP